MGSKKAEIAKKSFLKRRKHLAPNKPNTKNKQEKKKKLKKQQKKDNIDNKKQIQDDKSKGVEADAVVVSASQQLSFFVDNFQASNAVQLSSLELASFKDTCILEPPDGLDQDADVLVEQIKAAFGQSWKEVLCEGETLKGKVDPGNPAVLIISTSALRSLELMRAVRALTRDCHAAKLFSKHMKVEEQVSVLKTRVNIASGTPSRINKLIDMEALGLSRLAVIVLDMHKDVKGYNLFTLPQVRDEFWDLYKSYFHQRILQGSLRICLYGPIKVGK